MNRRRQIHRSLAIALLVAGCTCSTGCRRQVYQELYAEQNAREIRALEDRIYDYDSEYRALEHELWAQEDENERLREQLNQLSQNQRGLPSNRSSANPQGAMDRPDWEMPSVLVPDAIPDSAPNAAPKAVPNDEAEDESADPRPQASVKPGKNRPVVHRDARSQPNANASMPTILDAPELPISELDGPNFEMPAAVKPSDGSSVPSIERPMSPPVSQSEPNREYQAKLRTTSDSREDSVVPAASLQIVTPESMDEEKLQPEQKQLGRVVELRFHPTLCRGNNYDEDPADDGIYLVLQPLDDARKLSQHVGKLTIVAIDPAAPEGTAPIARWNFDEQQVADNTQPKGTSQGIHLHLRWQDHAPTTDRVHLFVRYVFPDGRQIVNDREVVLHQRDSLRSVWTPRVSR